MVRCFFVRLYRPLGPPCLHRPPPPCARPRPLRLFAALILFFLTLPSLLFAFEGTCVHVGDGDTVIVDTGFEKITIRLIGIDAPEIAHYGKAGQEPWGTAAKSYLSSLILGKEVRVEHDTTERDKYGRYLGYIYVDNMFVNEALLKDGHALAFPIAPNTAKRALFASAEATAKSKGIGIWNPAKPLTRKPVDFRHANKREDNIYSYFKRITYRFKHRFTPRTHRSTNLGTPHPKNDTGIISGKIIGNKNSKIFHLPGQENYKKISPANRVYFGSEQDAIRAGYRKAKR